MTEAGDQLAVVCPACSPEFETIHEVLSNGGQPTVRCQECDHVHSTSLPDTPEPRPIRTIVSQDGESVRTSVDIPPDAYLEAGERFVVETDEAVYSVEITSLEDTDGGRHDSLSAEHIETIWTRDIGNLSVNVTIHPQQGSGESSRSATVALPGDQELTVGEDLRVDGESVRVIGLLRRDAAVTDEAVRKLDEPGDTAFAMDVERVYARSSYQGRRDPW